MLTQSPAEMLLVTVRKEPVFSSREQHKRNRNRAYKNLNYCHSLKGMAICYFEVEFNFFSGLYFSFMRELGKK